MKKRRLLFFIIGLSFLTAIVSALPQGRTPAITAAGQAALDYNAAEAGIWLRLDKCPRPFAEDGGCPANSVFVLPGEQVKFYLRVENKSSSFAMRDVVVTDPSTPDCELTIGGLAPGQTYPVYSCVREDVREAFANVATVTGRNASNGQEDSDSATAFVEIVAMETALAAEPNAVRAPGGKVEFTAATVNLSSTPVQLNTLTSPELGDLTDPTNLKVENNSCAANALPQLAANGGAYSCSFSAAIAGPAGAYPFTVDVSAAAGDGTLVSSSGSTQVAVVELVAAQLTPDADEAALGHSIELVIQLQNLSETRSVIVTNLLDAEIGDIRPFGSCAYPQLLAPGETYACDYRQTMTGKIGELHPFLVYVSAETAVDPPEPLVTQATASVMVTEPTIHLPLLVLVPRPTSCATALLLKTNHDYLFYPDTAHAVYQFDLTQPQDVTVSLSNLPGRDSQVTVYKDTGEGCGPSLPVIGYDGSDKSEKNIATGEQPAGSYYIHVYNGSGLARETPYSLRIQAQ